MRSLLLPSSRPSQPPAVCAHPLWPLLLRAQLAVFAVEYFFALETIDARGARQLATTLASMKNESDPALAVGSDMSEVAWWALEWLQHLAHDNQPIHMLSVQWADTLVAFVETYTVASAGDLPYFGAHEGMVWLESETARVVLALDDAPPSHVAPQWLLLSDMCALTCRFGTRRGFASALGRCAAAGAVSDVAVLKIVALYVDTAAEMDRSPASPRSPHTMAVRISANGVAFLSAWAGASGFPSQAASDQRIRVANSIRILCRRTAIFKDAVAGFVRSWKAEIELHQRGSRADDFFDLGLLCGGEAEPAPALMAVAPPVHADVPLPVAKAAASPAAAGGSESAAAGTSRPAWRTEFRLADRSEGSSCCIQ